MAAAPATAETPLIVTAALVRGGPNVRLYDVAASVSQVLGASATPGDARQRTSARWLLDTGGFLLDEAGR